MARASTRRIAPEPSAAEAGGSAPADADELEGLGGIVLPLSAMISDRNGEVVLFNDSGLRSLAVQTDARLVGKGEARAHVTAGGDDVSGFRYMSFDNGIKLYYHPELEVVVTRETVRD